MQVGRAIVAARTEQKTPDKAIAVPPLRLLAADELGQLKAVEAPLDRLSALKQVSRWGIPNRSEGIQCMTASSTEDASEVAYLAAARVGGRCEVRDALTGALVGQVEASTSGGEDADCSIRGLHFLWKNPAVEAKSPALLSCTASGVLRIHQQPQASESSKAPPWEQVVSWQGPANVMAMAVDEAQNHVALGCNGSELSVWEIKTQERIYQAKGAKPNRVGLMEKPWNTAVAFLPGSGGRKVVVGTGQHKLRVYDIKQRRPVLVVDFGEARVTALAPEADGARCWAADSQGQIGCLDLKLGRMQQVLKGSGGSTRSLAIHPSEPIIASAGLDRFLRVHDLRTRKLLAKVYMKQHLTAVAFCSSASQTEAEPKPMVQCEEDAPEIKEAEAIPLPNHMSEHETMEKRAAAPLAADMKQKKKKQKQ